MTLFAVNDHNPPGFASFYIAFQVYDRIIAPLYVYPGHDNLIKILYFVVNHIGYSTRYNHYGNLRVELESKALGVQPKESGAVPTNTHQNSIIITRLGC